MQYEILFWSMLGVIVAAAAFGVVAGFAGSIKHSLMYCLVFAALLGAGVALLAGRTELADSVVLLCVATVMFAGVIGSAFSLLTRRVRSGPSAR